MFGKKKNADIELAVVNNEKISEEAKLKAAYALNLCTVSISQIVDYNDINILEQEYEAILNNLNLENIPKDEALLKILKQILDTITFFRIQEGNKKFIEKDYQQKMKNAIWSSVPNLSVIVASGNPFVALGALATQVGIGYMNYRKEKAKITNEHEKELWQLQSSAIEQFNALRRELFDTAWRLADRYKFKESYRLTERQIKQYNEILMDTDNYRKYERLYSIQNNFKAYPPFWYYIGDSAAQIANEYYSKDEENPIWLEYSEIAKQSFEEFRKCNNFHLLRDDQIASSCCLEYIDLLSPEKDKQLIKELISEALETAGNSNDILQLCAMNYLKIEEYEEACELLRHLVVEQYNPNTNAQLLSQLYLNRAIENNSLELLPKYETLKRFVANEYLYPFPQRLPQTKQEKEELFSGYIEVQRRLLLQKYGLVFNAMIQKYSIELNKKLQNPNQGEKLPDEYFLDSEENRNQRIKDLKLIMQSSGKDKYLENLHDYSIGGEYLLSLNNFASAFQAVDFLNKDEVSIGSISELLKSNKENFEKLDIANMQNYFGIEEFKKMSELKFSSFIQNYLRDITCKTREYVFFMKDLNSFVSAESQLREFCLEQKIPEPDILFDRKNIINNINDSKVLFSSDEYLSDKSKELLEYKKRMDVQLRVFNDEKYNHLSLNYKKVSMRVKGSSGFSLYISKNKKHFLQTINTIYHENKILAVLEDKRIWGGDCDLFFTADYIYDLHKDNPFISYKSALEDEDFKKIKNVNIELLMDLISELSKNEVHVEEENEIQMQEHIKTTHDYIYAGIPYEVAKNLDNQLLCNAQSDISEIDG